MNKLFEVKTISVDLPISLKDEVGEEISSLLKVIGVPERIVYADVKLIPPYIVEDYLIFGENRDLADMTFAIALKTKEVVTYYLSEKRSSFINTGLKELFLCEHAYRSFYKRLVIADALGNYDEFHEKYAVFLREVLLGLDRDAVAQGAWKNLIEEIDLGVI